MVHSTEAAPPRGLSVIGNQGKTGAISIKSVQQSSAMRPDDLSVTAWHFKDCSIEAPPGLDDPSSYPPQSLNGKENIRPELVSSRNSSIDNDQQSRPSSTLARKPCMDLKDAIALLDETCPNPGASPLLTPRTPRTPLTPHPRNKRARSKSSDNSSNYSNDQLSEKSVDNNSKIHDKEKKGPFLRRIGISKTEDRSFLSRLAPRIMGKPYLEKIGPSKAVEKPLLDQIGSSKTLDKFIFNSPRIERKRGTSQAPAPSERQEVLAKSRGETKSFPERRRSGKAYLSKMYSFETEDLDEATCLENHRDPLRGASSNDVIDAGPVSVSCPETLEQSGSKQKSIFTSSVKLVKCKVTTSEEILSSTMCLSSSFAEVPSWEYSPTRKHWAKKITSTPKMLSRRIRGLDSKEKVRSDESFPDSPSKKDISVFPNRRISKRTEVAFIRNLEFSPSKTRRQASEDVLDKKNGAAPQIERWGISSDNLEMSRETVVILGPSSSSLGSSGVKSQEYLEGTGESPKESFERLQSSSGSVENNGALKERTRSHLPTSTQLKQVIAKEKTISPSYDLKNCTKFEIRKDTSASSDGDTPDEKVKVRQLRKRMLRSVLRKQERIEHHSDYETDQNSTLNCPKTRISREHSQETIDLLTELKRVKSQLKTPTTEMDLEWEKLKDVTKVPKKVMITDREFRLSIERENSIRKPASRLDSAETAGELIPALKQENQGEKQQKRHALFEKRCMSLDFVDDDRPQEPEVRAISLVSGKGLPLRTEDAFYSDELPLNFDFKSSYSDVFISEELDSSTDLVESRSAIKLKHSHDVDDEDVSEQKESPKKKSQDQERTSDVYETISSRTISLRMKKRLGKISVEDPMKHESFIPNDPDCKSTVVQKRSKCFPL